MYARLIAAMIACVAAWSTAAAQEWPDSKGRDFWFTYLPNFHNEESQIPISPVLQREHQLYIYISAERPTQGTISWRDDDGTPNSLAFRIDDPRQVYQTSVHYRGVELRGIGQNGAALQYFGTDNETVTQKSFHIVANDDVTVYALNQAVLTSEAFLVLPTDAVSEDYVVLAYDSDVRLSALSDLPDVQSTPSQFAIVATADSTEVDITPSVPTPGNPTATLERVYLDQGDVYLVQADMRQGARPDLTGSLIRASKPVAVFAGHQRAVVPLEFRGSVGSRDCLVEQMNPIRTWGKSAFVLPLARARTENFAGTDIYRVLAAFDSTVVVIDGVERSILAAGEYFQDALTAAHEVRTSRPALTAIYKKSSGDGSTDPTRTGDPFMMLVPPYEQFLDRYRFVNSQSYEYRQSPNGTISIRDSVYKEQWLNVVIPTEGIASLRIDNTPVNPVIFRRIGSTRFSWAQIPMTDGVHEMTGDTAFGIYVYGYGLANSYGYIGGMSFRPLDVRPPVIDGRVTCAVFEGAVTDSLLADTKVVSVAVVPRTDVNVTFTLGQFAPPQAVVSFSAALRDPYLDGSVVVEAVDGVGQSSGQTPIVIPGFTVGVEGQRNDARPRTTALVVPIGRTRCDSIVLENYGTFVQNVQALRFTSGTAVDAPQAPFQLRPGERVTVRYCRTATVEQVIIDTLLVVDSCLQRPVLAATMEEAYDRTGPEVTESADPCSTNVEIEIADARGSGLGLMSSRILDSVTVNCVVTQVDSTILSPRYTVVVTDPYLDAIYGFEAIDSASNVTRRIDTIPGFTLSVNGNADPTVTVDVGVHPVGVLFCDSLDLANAGVAEIAIDGVVIQENTLFSVPLGQFTIDIASRGGTNGLVVCFEPLVADTSVVITDTIELRRGCLVRKIGLMGRGTGLAYSGISRCDVPVETVTGRSGPRVQAVPQPASGTVTLVVDRPSSNVQVKFVDVSGVTVLERTWFGEPASALLLDIDGVRPGAYGCIVTTEHGTSGVVCLIR